MLRLRFRLVHLRLALLLQPMLLELLRVERLLGTLRPRPALAAFPAITVPAAASPVAPAAPVLFAFLLRRPRAVLRRLLRPRLLRRAWRALIGTALALRTLGVLVFGLRKLALLLDLALRTLALGAIRPHLLLMGRALVAALLLVAPAVAVGTRLITPAITALLVIAPAVAVATRLAIASPGAFAAAMILPVTRFVARTFRALRPRRTHARLVRR